MKYFYRGLIFLEIHPLSMYWPPLRFTYHHNYIVACVVSYLRLTSASVSPLLYMPPAPPPLFLLVGGVDRLRRHRRPALRPRTGPREIASVVPSNATGWKGASRTSPGDPTPTYPPPHRREGRPAVPCPRPGTFPRKRRQFVSSRRLGTRLWLRCAMRLTRNRRRRPAPGEGLRKRSSRQQRENGLPAACAHRFGAMGLSRRRSRPA